MHRAPLLRALALWVFLSPGLAAAADAVLVVSPIGKGVPPAELAELGEALRVALERTGRFVAVPVASPAPPGEEAGRAQAGEAARAARARLAVVLRVSRLGSRTSLQLEAYRPDGTLAASERTEVSARSWDLPGDAVAPFEGAMAQLAAAVQSGSVVAPAAVLATPAPPETPLPAPPRSAGVPDPQAGVTFRTGVILPRSRAAEDRRAPVFAGAGLGGYSDLELVQLEAFFDAYVSDVRADTGRRPDRLVTLGAGVIVPFARAVGGPYLGVEGGYAWYCFGGDAAHGGFLRIPAGLMFDRWGEPGKAGMTARLEAAWFVTASPERDPATGTLQRPWGWTFSVVLAPRDRVR